LGENDYSEAVCSSSPSNLNARGLFILRLPNDRRLHLTQITLTLTASPPRPRRALVPEQEASAAHAWRARALPAAASPPHHALPHVRAQNRGAARGRRDMESTAESRNRHNRRESVITHNVPIYRSYRAINRDSDRFSILFFQISEIKFCTGF
jgi:hypothetical protein